MFSARAVLSLAVAGCGWLVLKIMIKICLGCNVFMNDLSLVAWSLASWCTTILRFAICGSDLKNRMIHALMRQAEVSRHKKRY